MAIIPMAMTATEHRSPSPSLMASDTTTTRSPKAAPWIVNLVVRDMEWLLRSFGGPTGVVGGGRTQGSSRHMPT